MKNLKNWYKHVEDLCLPQTRCSQSYIVPLCRHWNTLRCSRRHMSHHQLCTRVDGLCFLFYHNVCIYDKNYFRCQHCTARTQVKCFSPDVWLILVIIVKKKPTITLDTGWLISLLLPWLIGHVFFALDFLTCRPVSDFVCGCSTAQVTQCSKKGRCLLKNVSHGWRAMESTRFVMEQAGLQRIPSSMDMGGVHHRFLSVGTCFAALACDDFWFFKPNIY